MTRILNLFITAMGGDDWLSDQPVLRICLTLVIVALVIYILYLIFRNFVLVQVVHADEDNLAPLSDDINKVMENNAAIHEHYRQYVVTQVLTHWAMWLCVSPDELQKRLSKDEQGIKVLCTPADTTLLYFTVDDVELSGEIDWSRRKMYVVCECSIENAKTNEITYIKKKKGIRFEGNYPNFGKMSKFINKFLNKAYPDDENNSVVSLDRAKILIDLVGTAVDMGDDNEKYDDKTITNLLLQAADDLNQAIKADETILDNELIQAIYVKVLAYIFRHYPEELANFLGVSDEAKADLMKNKKEDKDDTTEADDREK